MYTPNGYNTPPDALYNEQIAAGVGAIGTVYYVDGNAGNDANDGLSWNTAVKTLSVAMALSHANIAAGATGWASRNRIYVKADAITENLTALAQKTDVIGVGSMDWRHKALLIGNHVIASTVSYMGCRFLNMEFKGPAAGGDLFTMTSQHGIEFIDTDFLATSTTAATGALLPIACVDFRVERCRFMGAYSDAVIEVGAGQADGLTLKDNFIQGANTGIEISGSATFVAGRYGLIQSNTIATTGACIVDSEAKSYVVNNRLFTAAAKGSAMAGAITCNIAMAQDNRITTSDANNVVYPAEGSI